MSELNLNMRMASAIHDIKNVLNQVVLNLDDAVDTCHNHINCPNRERLSSIYDQSKLLAQQLINILNSYKLDQSQYALQPEHLLVNDLLEDILSEFESLLTAKNIHTSYQSDENIYWFFDRDLVHGILTNALVNAMRYAHGEILLSAKIIQQNGYQWLCVSVDDNGLGFSEELLAQTSFKTTQTGDRAQGGTGLGFFFAEAAASLHQNHGRTGFIQLSHNSQWNGARFNLFLP